MSVGDRTFTLIALLLGAIAVAVVYIMNEPTPAWLIALGTGIAQAEGFGIPGAIPTTHNNPGDITDTSGNKVQFATLQDGYNALYANVMGGINGTSAYYSPDMSLDDFAAVWTGNDQAEDWLNTVLAVFNGQMGTAYTGANTLADLAATPAPNASA